MFISEECDNKLKSAFELYNQRLIESLPSSEELLKISFSEAFERRMEKLLSLQKKSYYRLINTVGKKVAVIIVAVIIGLTATTFSVKALREAVLEFITETHKKYTKVSTNIVQQPQNGFEKTAPQYIPEGYVLKYEENYGTTYQITYMDDEKNTIDYDQSVTFGATLHVNTEGVDYEIIKINSLEGIAYVKNGFSCIVFADETYFYSLLGKVPMEELIKMAESIEIN